MTEEAKYKKDKFGNMKRRTRSEEAKYKKAKSREYQAYLERRNELAYERGDRNYILYVLIKIKNYIKKRWMICVHSIFF